MKAHCWTWEENKVIEDCAKSSMPAKKAAKQAKKMLPNRTYGATLLRIYAKRKTMPKVVTTSVGKSFRVEMMNDHIRLYF